MTQARVRAGLLLLIAAALWGPVRAADLRELLRRSVVADRRFSYQGTKVLTRHGDGPSVTTTYKVYHRAPDRTFARAVAGDHPGAQFLQLGRDHFLRPSPHAGFRRPPLPPPADDTDLLLRNYRLRQMRVESIARRKCVMVALEPRYRGNPTKLVWLDVSTALPLKTQIRRADGTVTEESQFLIIQYHPRLAARLFVPPGAATPEWAEVEPDFDVIEVAPGGIPAGYRLTETLNRRLPDRHIASFQRFSDGLNTLTLIQSRTHPDPGSLGGSPAVEGQVGPVRFAVCGDQEPEVLRRLAGSLRGGPLSIRAAGH
jgi:negative regulator of sigma E activity